MRIPGLVGGVGGETKASEAAISLLLLAMLIFSSMGSGASCLRVV